MRSVGVGTTFKRMWVDECEERRVMTQEVAMGVDDPRNSRRGPGGLMSQWWKTKQLWWNAQ